MTDNLIEKLRSYPLPEVYTRKGVAEVFAQALLGEAHQPFPDLSELKKIFESTEFRELIDEGKITIAMIKPRLDEFMKTEEVDEDVTDLSDHVLAQILEDEIHHPLENILSVSLFLTEDMVDQFYSGGPKERQLQVPPDLPLRKGKEYKNRWEEFKDLMLSGPVTFYILYDENGKAIESWRDQVGNDWNVIRVREKYPDSLRARFAKDTHNNLLHGSDSISSVHREIELLLSFLEKTKNK